MATDLERLVVSLDADITRLTRQLQKAGVNLDDFAKTADKKAGSAKDAINKHLSSSGSGGLSTIQFQELSSAARHSFDAIIAGASPLRVLATEGVKASSAIGPGGLGGLAKSLSTSLAGVLTPARLAAGGVLGIGAAALYSYSQYETAQTAIKTGLLGVGAASHATVGDINAISDQVSATSRISVSAARQIATALAATGKIGVGQIGGIANLAKGYGVLTGQDTADAGKDLAKIFSDPGKGADELNDKLGVLSGSMLHYIQTLAAAGNLQAAQTALLAAAQPELNRAAQNVGALASAWDRVKTAVSTVSNDTGAAIASIVDPTLQQRIARLQAQRDTLKSVPNVFGQDDTGNAPDDSAGEVAAIDKQIAALKDQIATEQRLGKVQADRKKANLTSVAASPAIERADPQVAAIEQAQADVSRIQAAIEAAQQNGAVPEGGYEHALDALDAVRTKLGQLKTDYAQGGAAAASALRQADFSQQIAGASSYERGLRQLNFQYEQMIENAKRAGDLKAIPTLQQAQSDAVASYQRESLDRARSAIPVSSDLSRIIIGSEGNDASKNPRSSASGIGQFIDSTFIDQYKKVFSDIYAQIVAKNTGAGGQVNQAAVNAAVLANKSDVGVNEALIKNYAQEIGVQLQQAGLNGSDVRNQYLGYHFGAQGAIDLLRADPNASAASVLGSKATAANPGEVADRTAGQLIDLIYQRVARNTSAGRGQQSQVISEQAKGQAYDQSAAQVARLQSVQEQLNADRDAGGQLGQQFATAQDLIKASSDKLTPALQAQRAAILSLADARAKATSSTLSSQFETDQKNAIDALGRTSSQQQIFTQAKAYGAPGTDPFNEAADGLQRLQDLNAAKTTGTDFAKGLVNDLMQGTQAGKALENQLQRILGKVADSAIDNIASSLFSSALKSEGGGILSGLGGLLGGALHFATGGRVVGPGSGTSDSVPAMLSHGEFVVNAASSRKYGALLAALNSGSVRHFAAGGAVSLPAMPAAVRRSGASVTVTHAPTLNVMPAEGVTPSQLSAVIEKQNRQLDNTIGQRMSAWTRRFG